MAAPLDFHVYETYLRCWAQVRSGTPIASTANPAGGESYADGARVSAAMAIAVQDSLAKADTPKTMQQVLDAVTALVPAS